MTKKDKFLKCFYEIYSEDTHNISQSEVCSNYFLNNVALLANNKYNLNWCAIPENQEAWFDALEEFKNEN